MKGEGRGMVKNTHDDHFLATLMTIGMSSLIFRSSCSALYDSYACWMKRSKSA